VTEDEGGPTDARGGRTVAEWTTFVVSSAVLALVVVLIVVQAMAATDPAAPSARIGSVVPLGDRSGVHVTVRNDGDETAANVQVSAELVVDGETETGDLSVDFLAGGDEQELVFVFDGQPGDGELTVEVTGFEDP
jgi:uncharacterized protein (TIGR02588 family)